jgi:predicted Zn-dependent peptidase
MPFSYRENGVFVTVIPGGRFKTAHIAIVIQRRLSAGEAAVNALLTRVLSRGLKKARRAEWLYGAACGVSIVKKGDWQLVQSYADCPDAGGAFARAAHLAVDFLSAEEADFGENAVETEKALLIQEIEAVKDDPRRYAAELCAEEMFRGEPAAVPGDGRVNASLMEVDGRGLRRHRETLMSESPVWAVVLGEIDAAVPALSRFKAGVRALPEEREAPKRAKARKNITGKPGLPLTAGIRSESDLAGENYYALLTLNEMLGGGSGSMLFNALRESRGKCYYAASEPYRFKSAIIAQCGVSAADAPFALRVVENAVSALARGDFTESALKAAKAALLRRLQSLGDDPAGLMDFYLTSRLANDGGDLNAAAEKINGVTAEAAARTAQGLFVAVAAGCEGGARHECD